MKILETLKSAFLTEDSDYDDLEKIRLEQLYPEGSTEIRKNFTQIFDEEDVETPTKTTYDVTIHTTRTTQSGEEERIETSTISASLIQENLLDTEVQPGDETEIGEEIVTGEVNDMKPFRFRIVSTTPDTGGRVTEDTEIWFREAELSSLT